MFVDKFPKNPNSSITKKNSLQNLTTGKMFLQILFQQKDWQ